MSILQRGWIILREHLRDTTSRELHAPAAGILGVRQVDPGMKYDHQSVVSIHGVGDVDVMESVEEVFKLMDAGLQEFKSTPAPKHLRTLPLKLTRSTKNSAIQEFFAGTDYIVVERTDLHILIVSKIGSYKRVAVDIGQTMSYSPEGVLLVDGKAHDL